MKEIAKAGVARLPTRQQIAERAYQISQQRGWPGDEIDDRLQAEYELLQLPIEKIAELEPVRPRNSRRREAAVVGLIQAALLLAAVGLSAL